MSQNGMYEGTLAGALVTGNQSFTLTTIPVNLKPGAPVCVDGEFSQVCLTYTGGTLVVINGAFVYAHDSGAFVNWEGNAEPGLTGS
jgi:hypothetical protein